jgi:hypothetical protein
VLSTSSTAIYLFKALPAKAGWNMPDLDTKPKGAATGREAPERAKPEGAATGKEDGTPWQAPAPKAAASRRTPKPRQAATGDRSWIAIRVCAPRIFPALRQAKNGAAQDWIGSESEKVRR